LPDSYRIELERSGGFAGVALRTAVDSRELGPDEAREFARLLDAVDLAALARESRAHRPGADRFEYDLAVERGGRRTQITLGETQVTPELRPLLERLVDRARRSQHRP
jgi:hypothetical protein